MAFIIAQIIGIIIIIIRVIGIQFAQKKHILLSLCLVSFLFTIHYILLGSWLSVMVCIMGAIQTIAVTLLENRRPKIMLGIVITAAVVAIILGFFSFTSFQDIFPLLSVLLSTTALLMKKEQLVRIFLGLNSLCWFAFDLLIGAYTMSIADAIFIVSTLIAIVRFLPKSATQVQELESIK